LRAEESTIRENFLQIIESEASIDNRFVNVKRIDANGGRGNFSLVFTAFDEQTDKKVVLKFFDPLKNGNIDRLQRFRREGEMLSILSEEPYVINSVIDSVGKLHKVFIDPGSKIQIPWLFEYIAMEKADFNIEDFIDKKNPKAIEILSIFKEMFKAVIRVHNRNICHRDLKPDNFLVIGNSVLLSDFGTAKSLDGSMPDIRHEYDLPIGNVKYFAPELFLSIGIADKYAYNADMFSLGAILFELFTNTTLTSQIYDKEFFRRIELINQVLSKMQPDKRLEAYKELSKDLDRDVNLPEIFSYNDKVPNSIKFQIDKLYKSLAHINFTRRLNKPLSVHRQIDISLKILTNEMSYKKWKAEKRKRARIREERNRSKRASHADK